MLNATHEPQNTKPKVNPPAENFDLFRLSKAKQAVDLAPNTLRAYHAEGLPFYNRGKAVFVSKTDLAAFIRTKSAQTARN